MEHRSPDGGRRLEGTIVHFTDGETSESDIWSVMTGVRLLYDFTRLFSQRRLIRDYTTTLGSKALPGIGYVGCHLEIA